MSKRDGAGSLHEQCVVIVGGTSGIGREIGLQAAALGAHVWIVGRDAERGRSAVTAMQELGAASATFLAADLSTVSATEEAALELARRVPRIDALVLSAGVIHPQWEATVDDLETMYAVHHLAKVHLTRRLLPELERSPAAARVVVGAKLGNPPPPIDFDNLQSRGVSSFQRIGRLHHLNLLFTGELARRWERTPHRANLVHPGFVDTGGFRLVTGPLRWLSRIMVAVAGTPVQVAARNAIVLIGNRDVAVPNGHLFSDPARFDRHAPIGLDPAVAAKAWDAAQSLLAARGVTF